jgi:hypothetical protein
MTLAALANLICSKVRKTDAESVAACKEFLRQRHEMIYDAALWKDTLTYQATTIPMVEGTFVTDNITLPRDIAKPIQVRIGDRVLEIVDPTRWVSLTDEVFRTVGTPAGFSEIGCVGMPWPRGTEARAAGYGLATTVVLFTTTNAADAGRTATVRGVNINSVSMTETVTLTASQAQTTNGWKDVEVITKDATTGAVLVEDDNSNGLSFYLGPDETESRFCVIRVSPPPGAAITGSTALYVMGKRRLRPLRQDGDAPMIRGCDNALLAFGLGDMLERERQYGKAQAKVAEAQSLMQLMIDGERNQGASLMRIVPMVEEQAGGVADFGW